MSVIAVNTEELLGAVSMLPKMKRAPTGSKGEIPMDTILIPGENEIMVDTPAFQSLVSGEGKLNVEASVDGRQLRDAVEIHAGKKNKACKSDKIFITVKDRKLCLKGIIEIQLPLLR